MATKDDCIFCKIIAGEIPSRRVHEDDHAVVFLDIGAWQRGHSLVVPRRHVDDLLQQPAALTEIAPAIEQTARLLVDRLDADGINMVSSSGAVAGQEIFHLHVHLVPRYASDPGLRRLLVPKHPSDSELDAVHAEITGRA